MSAGPSQVNAASASAETVVVTGALLYCPKAVIHMLSLCGWFEVLSEHARSMLWCGLPVTGQPCSAILHRKKACHVASHSSLEG